MASEIARLYNSGCSDGDQVELAALLEEYMGEESSGDSSSDSKRRILIFGGTITMRRWCGRRRLSILLLTRGR